MIDCFLAEYLEIISCDTSERDSMPRSERRVPTSSGVATSVSYCFRFPPTLEVI